MHTATQKGLVTVKFKMEPSASRFTVQAFATGLLSSFGHNPTIAIRDYAGEVEALAEIYENASVRLMVKMSALEVLDEMKRDDREKLERTMYDEVLQASRFPEAIFQSDHINAQNLGGGLIQAQVRGNLTLRGVTRNHSFGVRVRDMGITLRISGEFGLLQSDYGITPVRVAGGALQLKDELKFKFEIVAKRQE